MNPKYRRDQLKFLNKKHMQNVLIVSSGQTNLISGRLNSVSRIVIRKTYIASRKNEI